MERSGSCASCGHCVSTTCKDNVRELFCHKNVCKATWDPTDITSPRESRYFKRGEHVILSHKGSAYNATVVFQRRGFNKEPGKVALVPQEEAGYFPSHPKCLYESDCPFYA